jgi:hypothetical protein
MTDPKLIQVDGCMPTAGKLVGNPLDTNKTRWEKFKAFLSGNRVRPNRLLLDPAAKIIGTFTIWRNGHVDDGIAITDKPDARAFQVLVLQLARQTFRASAQPIDKRIPIWWTPKYGQAIVEFLELKRQSMMQLNERMFDVTGNKLQLISQQPQIAKGK